MYVLGTDHFEIPEYLEAKVQTNIHEFLHRAFSEWGDADLSDASENYVVAGGFELGEQNTAINEGTTDLIALELCDDQDLRDQTKVLFGSERRIFEVMSIFQKRMPEQLAEAKSDSQFLPKGRGKKDTYINRLAFIREYQKESR